MSEEKKACEICGGLLPKGRRRYCSDACRREMERRRDKEARQGRARWGTYHWIICPDCGKRVWRPIRSIRCAECQEAANKSHDAAYRRRKDAGHARIIGEEYPCEACGKMYVLQSGPQRYCPECRDRAVTDNIRRQSRVWAKETYGTQEGRAKRAQMRRRASVPMIRECGQCGKKYETLTSGMYCSEECRRKAKQVYFKAYDEKRKGRKREEQNKDIKKE